MDLTAVEVDRTNPRIEVADLVQRQLQNPARAVGGPVDGVVMDAGQMAIPGPLHVKLEAEPKFEAGSEIGEDFFRCMKEATVSDDQWSGLGCCGVGLEDEKAKNWHQKSAEFHHR